MPAEAAAKYITSLHESGYSRAMIIGEVTPKREGHEYVTLGM
jgi:hydrogenase maturation factor